MNHSHKRTPQAQLPARRREPRYQHQRLSEARGAVVCWLREHPLSTATEIFQATGVSITSVLRQGMFKNVMREGRRCWRVVAHPEECIR